MCRTCADSACVRNRLDGGDRVLGPLTHVEGLSVSEAAGVDTTLSHGGKAIHNMHQLRTPHLGEVDLVITLSDSEA